MTDTADIIFRTRDEELKYNFCKSYREWRRVAEQPGAYLSAIEAAFLAYCVHRDAWVFGPEYLELSDRQKREQRERRYI